MKLEHDFTVPASVDETWAAFNDLERVVPCFPGASLSTAEGDEFTGSCKVKLGPISLVYNGSGRFLERDENLYRAVLEAKGKDKRGNGTASATVTAQLTAADAASTSVVVETDLSVTGKPAQFGRGVMQDVSDKMLAQFVDCLQTKLGPDSGPPPAPLGAEVPPTEAVGVAAANGAPGVASANGAPGVADTAGRREETPSAEPSSLDLGATMLPVLARRYGPYAVGILVLLLVVRRLLR